MRLSLGASLPSKPKSSNTQHMPSNVRPSAINTSAPQPTQSIKPFNMAKVFHSKPKHLSNVGLQADDYSSLIIALSLPKNHPANFPANPAAPPIASTQEIAAFLSEVLGIESFFIPQMRWSDEELEQLDPSTKAGAFLQTIKDDITTHGVLAERSYKTDKVPQISRERLLSFAENLSTLRTECGCASFAEVFQKASFMHLNAEEIKSCASSKTKCVRVSVAFSNSVAHHILALAVALAATTAEELGAEFESINDVAHKNIEGEKWKVAADRKRDSFLVATEMATSAFAKRATNLHTGRPAVALWLQANISLAHHKFVEVDIMDLDETFFDDTSSLATNSKLRQWLEWAATKEEEARVEKKMDEEGEAQHLEQRERVAMHVNHRESSFKLLQCTTVLLMPQTLVKLMKHEASSHCSVILRLAPTHETKRPKLHLSKFELRRSTLRIKPSKCSNMQDICNAAMEQAREGSTPGNSRPTSPWTPSHQPSQSPSPSSSDPPRSILKGSGTRSRSVSFDNHEQMSYAQAAQGRAARSPALGTRQSAHGASSDRAPQDTTDANQFSSVSDIDRKIAEMRKQMESLQRERESITKISGTNDSNTSSNNSSSESNTTSGQAPNPMPMSATIVEDIAKAVTAAVTATMEATLRALREELKEVRNRNNALERAYSKMQIAECEETVQASDERRKKRKVGQDEPTLPSLHDGPALPSNGPISRLQQTTPNMMQPSGQPSASSSQELTQQMPSNPNSPESVSRHDRAAAING